MTFNVTSGDEETSIRAQVEARLERDGYDRNNQSQVAEHESENEEIIEEELEDEAVEEEVEEVDIEDEDVDVDDEAAVEEDEDEEPEEEVVATTTTLIDDDSEIDLNGETINIAELKKGYTRQSDYTSKTQAVAEKQLATSNLSKQATEIINAEINQYQDLLTKFDNYDMVSLLNTNPDQYHQVQANKEVLRGKIDSAKIRATEFNEAMVSAENERIIEQTNKALVVVKEIIPDWSDATSKQLSDYLRKTKVSQTTIETINDPYLIQIIDKAMRYDSAKGKATATKAKKSSKKQKTIQAKATPRQAELNDKSRKAIVTELNSTRDIRKRAELMVKLKKFQ